MATSSFERSIIVNRKTVKSLETSLKQNDKLSLKQVEKVRVLSAKEVKKVFGK